jgi:hypothetical protein
MTLQELFELRRGLVAAQGNEVRGLAGRFAHTRVSRVVEISQKTTDAVGTRLTQSDHREQQRCEHRDAKKLRPLQAQTAPARQARNRLTFTGRTRIARGLIFWPIWRRSHGAQRLAGNRQRDNVARFENSGGLASQGM